MTYLHESFYRFPLAVGRVGRVDRQSRAARPVEIQRNIANGDVIRVNSILNYLRQYVGARRYHAFPELPEDWLNVWELASDVAELQKAYAGARGALKKLKQEAKDVRPTRG